MNPEEKLVLIKKAAEKILQIDIDSNLEKKHIYDSLKEGLNASETLETYLWDCVVLGLKFYEYDIKKILDEELE